MNYDSYVGTKYIKLSFSMINKKKLSFIYVHIRVITLKIRT